jgi:hypothetical protein
MDEFPIARHQRRSRILVETEFRVAGNAREFGKTIFVGEADEPPRRDCRLQRLRMDIGEVQHVHHDVRVEDEPGSGGESLHCVF